MNKAKIIAVFNFLLLTIVFSCTHSHSGDQAHSHDGDKGHQHNEESHDEHNNHGHSHDTEHAENLSKVILPSKVIAATNDAPEYIQMATNIEVLEDVKVAAKAKSSVYTHEGYFGPLLFGEELRSFSLKLEPGMFLAEHPHATESIVYTISGKWVLCSEGKRQVMQEGSIFHFGSDMPTGWEAPFAEGAQLLIFKKIRENENYESFTKGTRELATKLDKQYKEGEHFYFHQLESDHPAITFAKANNPDFESLLAQLKP